jgi:hypothetical protein
LQTYKEIPIPMEKNTIHRGFFLGSRQEMKIKKQNKIVPYILMFHFVKNKKNKKGFV